MSIAVVAEKPSVAKDIAAALGVRGRQKGFWEGAGYQITWAVGHLVTLAEPHQIKAEWKKWTSAHLPLIPERWPLVVVEQSQEQFHLIKKLLTSAEVKEVICATDAGREGELIFRYIYEKIACKKPVKRLWISTLTPPAIRQGFASLKDASHYDHLAASAKGRSRADWLVGMNLSRSYSLVHGEVFSVGRVQTPTLSMLAEREQAILNFTPEEYYEVKALFDLVEKASGNSFQPEQSRKGSQYEGIYFDPQRSHGEKKDIKKEDKADGQVPPDSRLPADGKLAKLIRERALQGEAVVKSIADKETKLYPPLLFDLTELQRQANRLYGHSAQRTLDIAQGLYERHKLISYPRTDSRYLSEEVAHTLPGIVEAIRKPYEGLLAPDTGRRPLRAPFVNQKKVVEHHAIIPTGLAPKGLLRDEMLLFDLICRRLLGAWHDPYISATTTVITVIAGVDKAKVEPYRDHYRSKGTKVKQWGWKVLEKHLEEGAAKKKAEPLLLPEALSEGRKVSVIEAHKSLKKTKPPPPMTEARLLTGMETAGSILEDKELSEAMRARGLGTPATRAQIIETLIKRSYVKRQGKTLRVTERGMHLIEMVHPVVKSPQMTGEWEAFLGRIERGEKSLAEFMGSIEGYICDLVPKILGGESKPNKPAINKTQEEALPVPMTREDVKDGHSLRSLKSLLEKYFGFSSFRPYQQEVCEEVTAGHDLLVVMPTGAGKSLCYQIPGIARKGTTIIISPLIALMEDQVAKLKEKGLIAERIHSGRERENSRLVCRQYLAGQLDYLFIAPERLGLPGFVELLAKRRPTLIAIDEAHCISHWGHDFRADYRKLGERLQHFLDIPKLALTATASPQVQRDIVAQLALKDCKKFICGFRRSNIAIEVAAIAVGDRLAALLHYLSDPQHRPAIVYAATRKDAEIYAEKMASRHKVRAYHAGMPPDQRQEVQEAFTGGKLDIIVATVAFGMGIDKSNIRSVVHLALPSSLSGYYQEIGRAGRDGQPSKAVLMFSLADQRTQMFLHELNYPELEDLRRLWKQIPKEGIERERLRTKEFCEELDNFLQKLWVHEAISFDGGERIFRTSARWEESYAVQKQQRLTELQQMMQYAEDNETCRMVQLVRHFGDEKDRGEACSLCDVCQPGKCYFKKIREPNSAEIQVMETILSLVTKNKRWSSGALYKIIGDYHSISRESFEALVNCLAQAKYLDFDIASFAKNGRTIHYRQISLPHPSVRRTKKLTSADLKVIKQYDLSKAAHETHAPDKKPAKKKIKRDSRPETFYQISSLEQNGLIAELQKWRSSEARKDEVPAYCVLPNKTLQAIATMQPKDAHDLLKVDGIGPAKMEKYGKQILAILADHS